jgi:tetratricopeptide (TPR) repeat protein
MEIHILQAGEQLGPFSEVQVRQYLGEGLIAPSDLATFNGMENWQSLEQVLANLPPSDRTPEMTYTETTPIESTSPSETAHDTGPQQTIDDSAPVTADTPPPEATPVDPIKSLTASQSTKRKLNKIVLQPILPLEPTSPTQSLPLRKKLKTGKTKVALEPLRPTTALPPVTGFAPKERKTGKTQLRTGQLSFGNFSEKSVVEPSKPEPPPIPMTLAAATPDKTAPSLPPPLPPSTAAVISDEHRFAESSLKAWYQRVPRELVYAGIALAVVIVCVISVFAFLFFTHHDASRTSNVIAPGSGSSPPGHVEVQSPKTAADYNKVGFARQSHGELDGAFESFNRALNLDPNNAAAFYGRGLLRQTKGDTDGALADYTQAIDLDPKQADAYSNRAFIKQGKNDLDGALADYAQALSLNPKISRAYYNEGLIKVQKGNLDGAIADYSLAIDVDPNLALAYYNRGAVKSMEGNADGAIADFTQALALDPKIARAFCARGTARQSKGDTDGAFADYSQAISLDPKLGDAFYNRSLIKLQRGDLDGAIADDNQAITVDPKNGAAFSNRGLASFGKGSLDNALIDLNKFCELSPRDSHTDSARLYIWLIATRQNPQGTADQDLSTAVLNDWNSPPEDLTSKIASFLLGHTNENDLIANAASPDPTREPPQYCKVWYFAGMKRLLAGDTTAAITDFQKSVATNPKDLCECNFAEAELKTLGLGRAVAAKPGSN